MARPGAKKRVKSAEPTVMRRAPDGSAFLTCEACNSKVPVATADMHSCENDAAFKDTLERLRLEFRERMAEEAAAKKQKAEEKQQKTKPAKEEKQQKRKAEKDSNAPKKPTTPYFLFLEDFRKQYKEEHPESKGVTEMSKAAGLKWKSLTEEEKEVYNKGASERKKAYEAQLEEYNMQSRVEGVGDTEDDDEKQDEAPKPAKKKRLVSKKTEEDETLNEELQDDIAD